MRLVRFVPALLLTVGCGGKKADDSGPALPTCDDYVTAPMPSLTPDQYPEGLAAGVEALQNLEGLWRGTHCDTDTYPGREIDIKITAMPQIPDEITVVQESITDQVACGCSADLTYSHDNALDLVALVPSFTLFFDPEDPAPIDPALDQREFQVSGALFAGNQGLFFRACETQFVAPYLQSTYDTAVMNVRIQTLEETTPLDHLGEVTIQAQLIVQEQGVEPYVCEITDLRKVQ